VAIKNWLIVCGRSIFPSWGVGAAVGVVLRVLRDVRWSVGRSGLLPVRTISLRRSSSS
jgi:hypothetical protein